VRFIEFTSQNILYLSRGGVIIACYWFLNANSLFWWFRDFGDFGALSSWPSVDGGFPGRRLDEA
jgi:hypothetical protein